MVVKGSMAIQMPSMSQKIVAYLNCHTDSSEHSTLVVAYAMFGLGENVLSWYDDVRGYGALRYLHGSIMS